MTQIFKTKPNQEFFDEWQLKVIKNIELTFEEEYV